MRAATSGSQGHLPIVCSIRLAEERSLRLPLLCSIKLVRLLWLPCPIELHAGGLLVAHLSRITISLISIYRLPPTRSRACSNTSLRELPTTTISPYHSHMAAIYVDEEMAVRVA